MEEKTIPKSAELTGDVEKEINYATGNSLLFHLKKGDVEFTIGLPDILRCLKFAEEEKEIPELPWEWWDEMADQLYMEELRNLLDV